jgi:hypothetical protein
MSASFAARCRVRRRRPLAATARRSIYNQRLGSAQSPTSAIQVTVNQASCGSFAKKPLMFSISHKCPSTYIKAFQLSLFFYE